MTRLALVAVLMAACADSKTEQLDNAGQWWCSTHVCTRDEVECTKLVPPDITANRMECKPRRLAFCPIGGKEADMLQCQPTRERCEDWITKSAGWPARCLGVE